MSGSLALKRFLLLRSSFPDGSDYARRRRKELTIFLIFSFFLPPKSQGNEMELGGKKEMRKRNIRLAFYNLFFLFNLGPINNKNIIINKKLGPR